MKKLTKKVVIATSAGLASMILNAACGYGPPVDYEAPNSTYGISSSEASTSDSTAPEDNSSEATSESSIAPGEKAVMEEVPGDAASSLESLDEYRVDPDIVDDNYKIPEVPAVYGPPTADD